jgi:hypothetical protein
MPGLIVAVPVAEGEHVHAGQNVVILESMKMEGSSKPRTAWSSACASAARQRRARRVLVTLTSPAPLGGGPFARPGALRRWPGGSPPRGRRVGRPALARVQPAFRRPRRRPGGGRRPAAPAPGPRRPADPRRCRAAWPPRPTAAQSARGARGDAGRLRHRQAILEGWLVCFIYEKYRRSYRLGECEIELDELPIGAFAEIEGPPAVVPVQAAALGFDWSERLVDSYAGLFERVRARLRLKARDLTFEAFQGVVVEPGCETQTNHR